MRNKTRDELLREIAEKVGIEEKNFRWKDYQFKQQIRGFKKDGWIKIHEEIVENNSKGA